MMRARTRVARRNGAIMRRMVRDILELGSSLGFLDEISDGFLQQPDAVDPSWRALLGPGAVNGHATNGHATNGHATNGTHGANGAATNGALANGTSVLPNDASAVRTGGITMSPIAAQGVPSVWPLVNAYRSRGHFN